MSLDKFVMRGYTGSTGNSTGQWVARTPDGGNQHSRAPIQGEGNSSFLFGGTATSRPNYANGSNSGNGKEYNEYAFRMDEVRHRGTTGGGHDNIPSNCFRSKHFRSAGGSSDEGVQSYHAITFLFMLIMMLMLVAVVYTGRLETKLRSSDTEFAPTSREIDHRRGFRPAWEPY